MNLIDRYVYAVTEYLPEDIREDVGKELRTNIEDMLPEPATEKDIYQVLEELGSPWKLANEYNPRKRYLIGPGYYDKYLSTLKTVIGICILVFTGIALLTWVLDLQNSGSQFENASKLITDLLSAVFEGALQGAFWVTIVFVVLERCGVEAGNIPYFNKRWTPEDLPVVPVSKSSRISRVETVFSMFFTILFAALVYFRPQLIAIYVKDDTGTVDATPLFNTERLQSYILIILLMAIIQLGLFVWKYFAGSWNKPLAIGNAIYNIASCILLIAVLNDNSLFNQEFISVIAKLIDTSSATVSTWLDKSIKITGVVVVIICTIDSISAFIKCRNITEIDISLSKE